ncbi:MAG: hypothetical protein ACKVVP_09820 [Chloroflexota bacterium]
MKTALTIGLLMILAGLLWKRRERLGLALRVGAILYGALMLARLAMMRDESDQLVNLGLGFGALIAIWLVARGVTAVVDRRRSRADQSAGGGDAKSASSARADK